MAVVNHHLMCIMSFYHNGGGIGWGVVVAPGRGTVPFAARKNAREIHTQQHACEENKWWDAKRGKCVKIPDDSTREWYNIVSTNL